VRGLFSPRTPPSARAKPSIASRYVPGHRPPSCGIAKRARPRVFASGRRLRAARTSALQAPRSSRDTRGACGIDSLPRERSKHLDAAAPGVAPPDTRVFFRLASSRRDPVAECRTDPDPPPAPRQDYAERHGYIKGVVTDIIHDPGRGAPLAKVRVAAEPLPSPARALRAGRNPKNTHGRLAIFDAYASPPRDASDQRV